MRRARLLLLFAMCVALFPLASFAQVQTGTPPFGTFAGGPEVIDVANLNSNITIPVVNKAGRGMNFSYNLVYDSAVWAAVNSSGTTTWAPAAIWGWNPITPQVGALSTSQTLTQTECTEGKRIGKIVTREIFWSYIDSNGPHAFPGWSGTYNDGCTGQNDSYGLTNDETTDGSGYIINVTAPDTFTSLVDVAGRNLNPSSGSSSAEDSNGNEITLSNGVYTDTLNTTALTITDNSPTVVYSYTAPSGATAKYTVNYTYYTVATNFGISGINEFAATAAYLVSSIVLPDGSQYTFKYEPTPSTPSSGACTPLSGTYSANCVTARVTSVTLPTSGTISYTYSGGNNGIFADGSTATLKRTTPDGTWTYARSQSGGAWTTTVTDPQENQTIYDFQGIYQTERKVYSGSSTLLEDDVTCYNGNTTNCNTTAITLPITKRVVTDTLGSQVCKHVYSYNSNGLLTEQDDYDYGSGGPPSTPLRKELITYASLNNNIVDRPSQVTIENGSGTVIAQTNYTYDQGSVVATSGTPQHLSISGNRGNPTTITYTVSSSATLSKTFTYYDTGNVDVATDVNGGTTTYTYVNATATCGNAFPSSVIEAISPLSKSMTYNCTGGVQLTSTDENGQTVTAAYSDADYWRPASTKDQEGNQTGVAYYPNSSYPNTFAIVSTMDFNGGNSEVGDFQYFDALGRTYVDQHRETPGGSTLDSISYTFDSNGRTASTSGPCAIGYASTCSGPTTTQTYDALNRPYQTTDGGGGTVTLTYSANDVLQVIGPKAGSENLKERQMEYNALGELASVCEITSASGSGSCAQNTPATGYLTKYTYDALGDLTSVTQNGQSSPSRTYAYDGLGRMTSETNPESGTTAYSYDSASGTGCASSSPGNLIKITDAAGNWTCYDYDALHRVTDVGNNNQSATNPCKRFRYDNWAGYPGSTKPSGIVNMLGRLTEAVTDNCGGGGDPIITDEWFSYTVRGEVSDLYQSTPHSSGYYHSSATYWANGVIDTLNSSSGYSTNYNVDGEGRVYSAGTGGSELASTVYNAASEATIVTFGSLDSDSFSYDPNTFRMTQYKYNLNGQSVVGNLTWNANGSLGSLAISDPFNSTNTQTCNYTHDDLARIASANCGSIFSDTYTYDAFGNLTKSGTFQFQPGYNSNNQMTNASYNSVGDVLSDGLHTYAWDVYNRPTTIDSVSVTYDALGRMVEQGSNGTYTGIQYSPSGFKMQLMNGQSYVKAWVPMPGGTAEVWQASPAVQYYLHADWLGSSRFASTTNGQMYNDLAYAPFGEPYAQFGPTGVTDISFAGNNEDTVANLYDAQNREYGVQGRWPSPDPAGMAAVSPANPQSWNRYTYAMNNPLSLTDPTGLEACRRPDKDPTLCENGGGMPSDCIIDGVEQPCSLGTSSADVECPGDVCSGTDANGNWGQFYAFVGGASGYYNPTEFANGINVIDGQLFDDANANAYLAWQNANQVANQCARLSENLPTGGSLPVGCSDPNIVGGHANFAYSCDDPSVCGPGRYDDGVHIECASGGYNCPGGPLVVHDDTISPWTGPFSFSSIFTANFWEHGFVDLMYGSVCNCVFPK